MEPFPKLSDLFSAFKRSSDQIGFLRINKAWKGVIDYVWGEVIGGIGPYFDASRYFNENVENWDGFFIASPELFFKFLDKFKDPLSIVSSSRTEQTLIDMMENQDFSFRRLVLLFKTSAQNDYTSLLQISFEHNEKIFSDLISTLPKITNTTLQQISTLRFRLNYLEESTQRHIVNVDIEKYLQHASKDAQLEFVAKDPKTYLQYLSEVDQKLIVQFDAGKYLKHALPDVQRDIIFNRDKSLLYYASKDVQKQFLKNVPREVQEEIMERLDDEEFCKNLQYISKDLQIRLTNSAFPGWTEGLSYLSEGAQLVFVQRHPDKLLAFADRDVQEKFLQHAAEESKEEYKNNNEVSAMELLQEEERGFMAESKQFDDNFDDNN